MDTKLRITCLIVSVDSTVDMPRRLPSSDASVLLPVPDVPASRMSRFRLDSRRNIKRGEGLTDEVGGDVKVLEVLWPRVLVFF